MPRITWFRLPAGGKDRAGAAVPGAEDAAVAVRDSEIRLSAASSVGSSAFPVGNLFALSRYATRSAVSGLVRVPSASAGIVLRILSKRSDSGGFCQTVRKSWPTSGGAMSPASATP
jgi:hypothetical protein